MPTTTFLDAQTAEPIRYTLRFPAPHTHYVEVEAVYPTARQASIEIFMAVWTPGSYLVREYERAKASGRYRPAGKNRQGLGRLCARIHPRKRLSGGKPDLQAVG